MKRNSGFGRIRSSGAIIVELLMFYSKARKLNGGTLYRRRMSPAACFREYEPNERAFYWRTRTPIIIHGWRLVHNYRTSRGHSRRDDD